MFADAALDDPTQLTPEQQEDRIHREVLLDLVEAARDFAHILLATARHASDPDDVVRLAAAFDRASRCARRGILLARHLRKPLAPKEHAETDPAPRRPAAISETKQRELRDRLDAIDPSRDIALGRTPLPDAIVALHRDLNQVFEELSKPLYKPKPSPPSRPDVPDH